MKLRQVIVSVILSLLVLFSTGIIQAQQTVENFVRETGYLLSLPNEYAADTAKKWPLILFLHGSGESGTDIEKVKLHGPPELIAKGKQFPFIVVSPQSDVPYGWDIEMLYSMLQDLKKKYRVDNDRVYLTGLSMGGFGTLSLAIKYPDEFAAIAPVCGGGDTSGAWKLRHTPTWCFHGAKDDVVPPVGSVNMVNAIREYSRDAQLTIFPNANHNSWDSTYKSNDNLYNWFLTHTKFRFIEKSADSLTAKKLAGIYVGPDKDTVQIEWTITGLVAKPPHQEIPLKHAGNNVFFIDPAKSVELRFEFAKNNVAGFLFMGNDKNFYRRVR